MKGRDNVKKEAVPMISCERVPNQSDCDNRAAAMDQFRSEKVQILVCADATGMVCCRL